MSRSDDFNRDMLEFASELLQTVKALPNEGSHLEMKVETFTTLTKFITVLARVGEPGEGSALSDYRKSFKRPRHAKDETRQGAAQAAAAAPGNGAAAIGEEEQ